MSKPICRQSLFAIGVAVFLFANAARANDVGVEAARFVQRGDAWTVHVTLRHADTGWEHYADAWRIVTEAGEALGVRTLYHPHVTEQPFTRSLSGVSIPAGVSKVYVEAHDKTHGWSPDRILVDLTQAKGDRFRVERK